MPKFFDRPVIIRIETVYINSVPEWADQILEPFKPASNPGLQAGEQTLGSKLP